MKIARSKIFIAVGLILISSIGAQVPTYIPAAYELVHYLDQYKKPDVVAAIKKFKDDRPIKFKNSKEILGAESKCSFDVSALVEGTNKDSGRWVNKLGFYSSCEANFRPAGSKSVDSVEMGLNSNKFIDGEIDVPTEYKKYYLAKIEWLFGKISKAFIGYCVPE